MEIQKVLENNPVILQILKDCPYEVLKYWEIKEYPKGYIVCNQEEVDEYFYIIINGYANIYRTAENGKKYSQSVYKKGNYFGELEIFDKRPYICSVEALTELKVIRIHRKYFLQWIEKDRNFLIYITKTLCDNFYKLSKKAGEDTLYSLKYRVCNYLVYCVHSGIKTEKGIKVQVNKEHLSEMFVVTQRSINRILKYLKEKEIIEVGNKCIYIKSVEKLKEEEQTSLNE